MQASHPACITTILLHRSQWRLARSRCMSRTRGPGFVSDGTSTCCATTGLPAWIVLYLFGFFAGGVQFVFARRRSVTLPRLSKDTSYEPYPLLRMSESLLSHRNHAGLSWPGQQPDEYCATSRAPSSNATPVREFGVVGENGSIAS